jgi:hypothetical protein
MYVCILHTVNIQTDVEVPALIGEIYDKKRDVLSGEDAKFNGTRVPDLYTLRIIGWHPVDEIEKRSIEVGPTKLIAGWRVKGRW